MNDSSELRVVCYRDEQEFYQLRNQWNSIADQCAQDSVFLRYEWFDASWQWLKKSAKLRLFCAFRDNTLIGIFPLVRRWGKHHHLNVRKLEFLAVPDTQSCDAITSEVDKVVLLNALAEQLYKIRYEWDLIELSRLPADSSTVRMLLSALERFRIRAFLHDSDRNPYISLEGNWQSFYGTRSRRLKKGNNLAANRINKAAKEIDLKWLTGNSQTLASVEDVLSNIIELSSKCWKKETGNTLDNEGPNAFIHRLTSHAYDQGWLSIWLLSLDQKPVAMEYQLAYKHQIHALRSDFDPDYEKFSPGAFTNWKLLERLFDSGFEQYLMGPGDVQYKWRWTEQYQPLSQLSAYSPTPSGKALALLHKLISLAKGIIELPNTKQSGSRAPKQL